MKNTRRGGWGRCIDTGVRPATAYFFLRYESWQALQLAPTSPKARAIQVAGIGGGRKLDDVVLEGLLLLLEPGGIAPDLGTGVAAFRARAEGRPRQSRQGLQDFDVGLDLRGIVGRLALITGVMRPKCEAISESADWRYLTASSGLANCAWADVASSGPTVIQASAASMDNFFITISRE